MEPLISFLIYGRHTKALIHANWLVFKRVGVQASSMVKNHTTVTSRRTLSQPTASMLQMVLFIAEYIKKYITICRFCFDFVCENNSSNHYSSVFRTI